MYLSYVPKYELVVYYWKLSYSCNRSIMRYPAKDDEALELAVSQLLDISDAYSWRIFSTEEFVPDVEYPLPIEPVKTAEELEEEELYMIGLLSDGDAAAYDCFERGFLSKEDYTPTLSPQFYDRGK